MKCTSQKRIYHTYEQAVEALINARTRFDYPAQAGPVAVYQCDDCQYFHLTSKGEMNETLASELAAGRIQLQKEADHWARKLKK